MRLAGVRMVAWQIPLGNTLMRVDEQHWDHFQDNRVQWILGPLARICARTRPPASSASCSAAAPTARRAHATPPKDGVTNPAPINGNTRPRRRADDDGGLFKSLARSYYAHHALSLPR